MRTTAAILVLATLTACGVEPPPTDAGADTPNGCPPGHARVDERCVAAMHDDCDGARCLPGEVCGLTSGGVGTVPVIACEPE
jgi:hypothetical protein